MWVSRASTIEACGRAQIKAEIRSPKSVGSYASVVPASKGVIAVGMVQLLTAQLSGKSTHAPLVGHSSVEVSSPKACPPIYQKQTERQHLQDLQTQRVSTKTA